MSISATASQARPVPSRRAAERQRAFAWFAASAAAHLAILILIFGGAAGDLVSAAGETAGNEAPGMQVSLVDASALTTDAAAPEPASSAPMALLKARFADRGVVAPAGPHPNLSGFAALAERLQSSTTPTAKTGQARPAPSGSPQSSETLAKGPQGQDNQVRGRASTGELWGRIEPCWRDIGGRLNRSVSLELSLDGASKLDKPPVVLRAANTPLDPTQLSAEAAALQALQQCLPRGDPRFGGKVYRVEFKAGG